MTVTIQVYLDDGRVFEYDVESNMKAREHTSKIIETGYRHTAENTNDLEWFPPHRIDKVKVPDGAATTQFKDRQRAT